MSTLYGTVRPSNINIGTDVEILYFYRPTRSSDPDNMDGFKQLSPDCLVPAYYDSSNSGFTSSILGLYELRLPLDTFNQKGYYTVYIRPKEVKVTLTDVSVLAAYPDVKGVVINTNANGLSSINDLTGYRIDYLSDDGAMTEISRLITSCNKCEPVLVTVSDSYPKATRYKLTDNTSNSLFFCTVTPSTATSMRPNVTPFIGKAGGNVIISNTKFDPVMLEIEMVDNDIDALMNMVAGDQIMNRDKAIITTYNSDGEIFKQQDYYTVKDKLGETLYTVKRNRPNIDTEESYDNRIDNV